jgi:putative transposase
LASLAHDPARRHRSRLVDVDDIALTCRAGRGELFLRKQLALYLERQVTPLRADDATRFTLVALSRFVEWRGLLTIVKPDTLIRWHRKGFRLLWRWKSSAPGRPRIPRDLRELIVTMAAVNRTWGEERIAAEFAAETRDSGVMANGETVHARKTAAQD